MRDRLTNVVIMIREKNSTSFWIALVAMIATALAMRPSSGCLTSDTTSLGIVDLELAYHQSRADSIRLLWSGQVCDNAFGYSATDAALTNIFLDFPFIIAYTLFLVVLVALTSESIMVNIRLTYLAILAAILDVAENAFMLAFLMDRQISSLAFAVPASVKFALILLIAGAVVIRLSGKLILRKN